MAPGFAVLEWAETDLVFKPSPAELRTVAVFPFNNAGERTVKILQMKPSCDCVTIINDRKEVPPREAGEDHRDV